MYEYVSITYSGSAATRDKAAATEAEAGLLTIHHSFMHAFSNSNAIKIVENHDGNAIVLNAR
jgi:hypothetical protein